jgi:hypothetical protein
MGARGHFRVTMSQKLIHHSTSATYAVTWTVTFGHFSHHSPCHAWLGPRPCFYIPNRAKAAACLGVDPPSRGPRAARSNANQAGRSAGQRWHPPWRHPYQYRRKPAGPHNHLEFPGGFFEIVSPISLIYGVFEGFLQILPAQRFARAAGPSERARCQVLPHGRAHKVGAQ